MPFAKPKRPAFTSRAAFRAITGTPWAIEPAKLDAFCEVLSLRAAGLALDEDEIRLRLGAAADWPENEDDDEPADPYAPQLVGSVAVVRLYGMLFPKANLLTRHSGATALAEFCQRLSRAAADPAVRAIVLDVDSPGGSVSGCHEAADLVFSLRKPGRPLIAVANGLAASAAYWIASQCDRVIASPSALVGSIGALMVQFEHSAADRAAGQKFNVISAGRLKTAGNEYEPLSAEARAALQRRIDDAYADFTAQVGRGRGITADRVRSQYGEGQVFYGPAALAANLVDELATLEETVVRLNDSFVTASGQPPPPATLASVPTVPAPLVEPRPMTPRIKAALFAIGCLEAIDAADPVAAAALTSFFAAHGQSVPAGEKDVLAQLSLLSAKTHAAPTIAAAAAPLVVPAPAAPTASEAEIRTQERARIADLKARGQLLGVADADVEAAINAGTSGAAAVDQWTRSKAAAAPPLAKVPVQVVQTGYDTFAAAAEEVLLARTNFAGVEGVSAGKVGERKPLSAPAQDLAHTSFYGLAEKALAMSGRRLAGLSPEQVAAQFLAMGGDAMFASDGNYNTPSDYPSILSSLAGKMLLKAQQVAEVTFRDYAYQQASVPDFKPKTLHQLGWFGQLDSIREGQEASEDKLSEETNFLQIGSYAKKFGLTPKMVIDDDLDGFARGVIGLQIAHDLTLNALCLGLLTSNVTMADGYQLYDDTHHANDLTSGAAPSVTQLSNVRKKLRAQTDVSGRNKIRASLGVILVPAALEKDAEQTLAVAGVGQVVYTADSGVNTFRASVKYAIEPNLDATSQVVWYGFTNPAAYPALVYAYLRGNENGARRSWYDPNTENRFIEVKGRFAAAVADHRGTVRNAGA